MSKVTVIIPSYNESENILPTTTALLKVFSKIKNHELSILFVDDSSPDGTSNLIKQLQKKHKNIHLIINPNKVGLGYAYIQGMEHTLNKLNSDIVFEFDADLSHDPALIPAMLEKIEKGADIVIGSRYRPGGSIPQNWGTHRKFLSIVGNLVIKLILINFRVTDWTTGYRAIKAEAIRSILPSLDSSSFFGYTFQIGFLHKATTKGYIIEEVPLRFVDRTLGHSKIGPEYIINTLSYIMKVRMKDLLQSRIFKFAVVGAFGALVQIVSLQIYRRFLPFQLAFFLGVETAIVSNFIWNNIWTFRDRKLKPTQIPSKFLQFNLTSGGSILIQQAVAIVGEITIGLIPLFTVPIINFIVDTGTMYAVLGILLGMFWNFFAYNRFIWKKK